MFLLAPTSGKAHTLCNSGIYKICMWDQYYSRLSVSYICLCPGCLAMSGYWVRFKTRARSVPGTTVRVAQWTVDLATRFSRLAIKMPYLFAPRVMLQFCSIRRVSVHAQVLSPWGVHEAAALLSLEAVLFHFRRHLLHVSFGPCFLASIARPEASSSRCVRSSPFVRRRGNASAAWCYIASMDYVKAVFW